MESVIHVYLSTEGEREGGREGGCVCVCACVLTCMSLSLPHICLCKLTPSELHLCGRELTFTPGWLCESGGLDWYMYI